MNIVHLKYAVEIAKTQSISKAAENLYMSQPNLSRAVRELEENLGISIFRRTSKGISITPEGEEFLQYARRIIAQVDEVEELYRSGREQKQHFSICVPRSSYISFAMAEFANAIRTDQPAEIFYKETNASRTVRYVLEGQSNLGIVRYQTTYDPHFRTMFQEKDLAAETITDFSYVLLMSKKHPLAEKPSIATTDLKDYIEISHADPYVPTMPIIEVRKAELSQFVDKHIFVYERASQFDLLEQVPNTFMWVSAAPQSICDKYGLVQRRCPDITKLHKDVLIYRSNYQLTELDNAFIAALYRAKVKYIDPMEQR